MTLWNNVELVAEIMFMFVYTNMLSLLVVFALKKLWSTIKTCNYLEQHEKFEEGVAFQAYRLYNKNQISLYICAFEPLLGFLLTTYYLITTSNYSYTHLLTETISTAPK